MSRSTIAGRLPLLRDGRVEAELIEFQLESQQLEFTLEVPLPEHLLNELYRRLGQASMHVPSSPLDGSLLVTWAHGCAKEVGLQLPARNSAIGRLQVRDGQATSEPALKWIRCSIDGANWLHRMRFQPLPKAGDLTFRFSSPLLDVKSAVGVVAIADLRSRVI